MLRSPLTFAAIGVLAVFVPLQSAPAQTDPGALSGIVIDDAKARFTGEWKASKVSRPFLGESYRHDLNEDKGRKSAEFTLEVEKTGPYAVLLAYTAGSNRDTAVPVTILTADGAKTVTVDQTKAPAIGSGFQPLGTFFFEKGSPAKVRIETEGTTGHVVVDGLRLLTEPELAEAKKTEKKPPRKKVAKSEKKPEPPQPVAPVFQRQTPKQPGRRISSSDVDALFIEHTGLEQPLPRVDDIHFLRRVSLDLIGRQPTLEEFRLYLKDQDPDRRQHAVDRLLASPDFGKNWGNFWSDVIGARQAEPQLTFLDYETFRTWLAKEFNAGTGWDEMVFKMLTAVGKVGENPQATFIGFHQGEPNKLAGETTRVFLSTKIACAQCHDHPFIEMPQETFHGFAAFFARTKVKLPWNDSDGIEVTSSAKGEHKMPGSKDMMAPAVFGDPEEQGLSDLERRERLAYWVVSGDNPFFARAFVNHVWARLMGRGFYDPVDDMGEMADAKLTELHNALADHFEASKFDARSLFRVIVGSRAYQQAPRQVKNPKVRFTGATPKKLRGDEVFDSLAVAIDLPNLEGEQEKATSAIRFPPPPKSTRDIINEAFGYDPAFQDSLINRTMKQAMLMMNNQQILDQIRADPKSETMLARLLKAEKDDKIVTDVLYARVLARRPTDSERAIIESHLKNVGHRKQAFEDLLWSLVNSAEFTTRN